MPTKLSESLPMQLSCEEGWKMDTVDLAHWLKELAQQVEAQAGRLDILEGKHKDQAPVDRQLVEEALGMALRGQFARHAALGPATRFEQIIDVLCRALKGDLDAQEN